MGDPCRPFPSSIHRSLLVLGLLGAIGAMGGCDDGPSGPDRPRVERVEVSPRRDTLTWLGEKRALEAEAVDEEGGAVGGTDLSWSSDDTLVATVDEHGVVTAESNGTTTIRATVDGPAGAGGVAGSARITVAQAPVRVSKAAGGAQEAPAGIELADPLVVEATDRGGSPVPGALVEWTASDGGEVTVVTGEEAVGGGASAVGDAGQAGVDASGQAGSGLPSDASDGDDDEDRSVAVGETDDEGRARARWRLGGPSGGQTLRASVEGHRSVVFSATAGPEVVASVEVSPEADTLEWIGETLQLSAEVTGSAGGSLADEEVAWGSDDGLVVGVDSQGVATARSNGIAVVRASVDGVGDTALVVVRQRPAGIEAVSGDAQVAEPGDALPEPLTVRVADQGGTGVPDVALSWAVTGGGGSLTGASESTDAEGIGEATWVLGDSAGIQSVEVTADPLDGPFEVTAFAESDADAAVSIVTIEPTPLVEGGSATISGTGLGGPPTDYDVTVDGVEASVVSTGPGALELVVPTFRCAPAREVTVTVARPHRGSDGATHPLHPPRIDSLDVGSYLHASDPGRFCVQLPPAQGSETYLLGVQSLTEIPSAVTPAVLFSTTGLAAPVSAPRSPEAVVEAPWEGPSPGPGGEAAARGTADGGPAPAGTSSRVPGRTVEVGASTPVGPGPPARGRAPPRLPRRGDPGGPDRLDDLDAHRRAESELRRYERELIRTLGGPERIREGVRRASLGAATAPAPPPTEGDTLTVRVPRSCSAYDEVDAVVRTVGEHGVWMEDVDNPSGGFEPGDFEELSELFDQQLFALDRAYFGEPTDLDDNGRVAVLVTREVNRVPGLLGFVFGGDLFARSDCPSSDQGEIFYGLAPDPDGVHGQQRTTADVRDLYPNLIAHEVTHIIQFARRIHINPGALASTWISEGQATFAEEAVGYSLLGLEPRSNYGGSLWQDSSPWFDDLFFDLVAYFGFQSRTTRVDGAPHECSWLARPSEGNASPCLNAFRLPYGVPALFFRWLLDHHGGTYPEGQQAMMRAMVDHPETGFSMVESVVGEDIDRLLARWAMALYVDDAWFSTGPATFPSWDFADIFSGFVETARLRPDQLPTIDGGAREIDVAAGSTAYFVLETGDRPYTAVGSSTPLGTDLPSHMRFWVLRLR